MKTMIRKLKEFINKQVKLKRFIIFGVLVIIYAIAHYFKLTPITSHIWTLIEGITLTILFI